MALTFILLVMPGCAQRINMAEYDKKFAETVNYKNTLIGTVYYCGSRNDYDYILFSPAMGFDDLAKMKTGLLKTSIFPYTNDRSKWQALPFPYLLNKNTLTETSLDDILKFDDIDLPNLK